MTTTGWTNFNGGRSWRILPQGWIEIEGKGVVRTRGEPVTMEYFVEGKWRTVKAAAQEAGVDPLALCGLAGIEMAIFKLKFRRRRLSPTRIKSKHIDSRRMRWEKRTRARPKGENSVGDFQLLTSTASSVNRRHKIVFGGRDLDEADLMQFEISARVAAHYLKDLQDKWGTDPMLLQAAWNAGGVHAYDVDLRPYGMKTHGPIRPENYAKWHNDALHVLLEKGYR